MPPLIRHCCCWRFRHAAGCHAAAAAAAFDITPHCFSPLPLFRCRFADIATLMLYATRPPPAAAAAAILLYADFRHADDAFDALPMRRLLMRRCHFRRRCRCRRRHFSMS